jgi:hypothetical protein
VIPSEFDRCFGVLGLDSRASLETVRARYRRLLFLHHPDRRGDDAYARHQFAQVTHAYRALVEAFARHGKSHPHGRCRACNEWADVFRAPDGNFYCEPCATGLGGRRALPAPPITVATFGGVMALLAAAAILLVRGLCAGTVGHLIAAIGLASAAMAWLLVVCLLLRYTVTPREREQVRADRGRRS